MFMSDVVMTEKKAGVLSKSMKLVYVYAMATGAIFTFMCYWDGIFMSYTGPATFLAFALMTLAVLPTAFVYAEYSTMLPSTGSCLVFNTVGLNKHAGFWSAWLIMCAWIAVPAAGVLGIIDWLNYQFHLNLVGTKAVIVGALVLCAWCVLSMYKNVVAGKVQSFMLFAGIAGILICSVMFLCSGHWSISNFTDFFTSSNMKQYGGSFASTGVAWIVGCSFMITPYFGFETVPAMVEEGDFPIIRRPYPLVGGVDNEERSASRKRADNRVQEFVWAFGSDTEAQIEKQILKQIEQLKKDGNVEELLHGRWSHMEALDEDEWLEHLEEHLKEIVNISGKDEKTLAMQFEAHRREVYERIAKEHPELAKRFQERRHKLDEHLKQRRPEVYELVVRLREENQL